MVGAQSLQGYNMWRAGVAWVAVVVAWAGVGSVWAASLSQHLPAEHRQADQPLDILSGIPSATSDMFTWNRPDGSYRFGYQGPDHWRVESRDASGSVRGRYAYRTPEGKVVDVSYDAGPQGYRAMGDAIPGGAAPPLQQQQQQQESNLGLVLKQAQQQRPQQQQQVQQVQGQQEEDLAVPYGALLLTGVEATLPSGDGISTFLDDNNLAIVTDVQLRQAPRRPVAVYPIVIQPGTTNEIVGPPLINDRPVLPGALPV